ncbi:MAG: hypothetical protein KGI72_05245 [Patescibacteria group bacterium]|nr:hypothetical protein [Patescibacteria group bacterium]
MKKLKNYRHGDLVLIGIEKLPEGLTEATTKELIRGSGGNPHTIDRGEIYFKEVNEFVFGYLVAKDTTLRHREHGKKISGKELLEAKINDGVYELRRQVEKTHEGMAPVQD